MAPKSEEIMEGPEDWGLEWDGFADDPKRHRLRSI
jgi:hypothetical protein